MKKNGKFITIILIRWTLLNRKACKKVKKKQARNLKELGVADDIIIKSTGLSKEEIEKL